MYVALLDQTILYHEACLNYYELEYSNHSDTRAHGHGIYEFIVNVYSSFAMPFFQQDLQQTKIN